MNPANGKVIGSVPDMDAADTEKAVQVAYKAFQSWKETTAKVRANYRFEGVFDERSAATVLNCIRTTVPQLEERWFLC